MSSKTQRRLFLDDLCRTFGIDRTDGRRSEAAMAHRAFGEEQCRAWLAQADGDYRKWKNLADIKRAPKLARLKVKEQEEELAKKRFRDRVTPTTARKDPSAEMDTLQEQYDSQPKESLASYTNRTGLRSQMARLKDEDAAPKM